MDPVRVGLSVRALRHRKHWRLVDLTARSGISASAISRLERGQLDGLTVGTVERVGRALGARVDLVVRWQGEGLDRLLDQAHAGLVDLLVKRLVGAGWLVQVEASFNLRGERGSIDALAFHPASATLLVGEVKSVVPDMQAMLAAHDRKIRLGPLAARRFGWAVQRTVGLLVIGDARTARRRVEAHAAQLAAAYPLRGRTAAELIRDPAVVAAANRGLPGALLFLSDSRRAAARHRIRRPRGLGDSIPCREGASRRC